MNVPRSRRWVWLILGFGMLVVLAVFLLGPSRRSPDILRDHLDSAWMSVGRAFTREPLEPTADVYPFLETDLGGALKVLLAKAEADGLSAYDEISKEAWPPDIQRLNPVAVLHFDSMRQPDGDGVILVVERRRGWDGGLLICRQRNSDWQGEHLSGQVVKAGPDAGFRRLRENGTFWHWYPSRTGKKPAVAPVDGREQQPAGTNRAPSADSNVLEIPVGDERGGAVFFVDECLTRGLTNSISIGELRRWATNTIQTYRVKGIGSEDPISARTGEVASSDVPSAIRSMQARIPSCRRRGHMDGVESVELVKVYSQSLGISEEEAEKRLSTIAPDPSPPQVGFHRTQDGILAVTITWYAYGIVVGPESFEPERLSPPWYQRKLADGVFLWHGYK